MDVKNLLIAVRAIAEMPEFVVGTKKFRRPSIMIRGPHGIGKTDIVHQIGDDLAREVIDCRLGQYTEGDLTGLPFKHTSDLLGEVTRYAPAEFVRIACTRPVILFFDEMNRATKEVLQGVFQIVQDGKFQSNVLHEDTLIICAVNNGSQYQLTQMDPALKDRFWICDITPTFEDWIAWARGPRGMLPEALIDFHVANSNKLYEHFEVADEPDPDRKYPSRRSWEKLGRVGKPAFEKLAMHGPDSPEGVSALTTLRILATGFVGVTTAIAFEKFLKDRLVVTAQDLLLNWDKVGSKKVAALGDTRWFQARDIIVKHAKHHDLTEEEAKGLSKVLMNMDAPTRLSLWMAVATDTAATASSDSNPRTLHNVTIIHQYIAPLLLSAINGDVKSVTNTAGALP